MWFVTYLCDLAEILHTCSLGDWLFIVSFFKNFDFWGLGMILLPKRGQNFVADWWVQKLSDLAEILHTCFLGEYLEVFLSFFKNFDFWDLGTSSFAKARLKLWVSLETSKLIRFGWNFKHLILGQISDGYSLHFLKILIFFFFGGGLEVSFSF